MTSTPDPLVPPEAVEEQEETFEAVRPDTGEPDADEHEDGPGQD